MKRKTKAKKAAKKAAKVQPIRYAAKLFDAFERHGGRVWAEGALGAGATFYFALPAA